MSHKTFPTRLLTAMMATGLMLATTTALAQETRAEQRRAERAAKAQDGQQAQQADRFAGATRKEPDGKTSSRAAATRLGKLSDAYEAQDVEKTQALADEIIADEKSNAFERSSAARIAGALLLGDDDAKALSYLERALEFDGLKNRDHYEVKFIVAQLHAQDDRNDQALATLDELIAETSTTDPDILAFRGNVLLRMERYDEAIATLKPLAESPDAKLPWQQLLMAAYAQSDRGEEATRLAEQIAATTPDDKRSQLNLAVTYLQTDQYDKAAAVYERLRAKGELTEEREYRNLVASYLALDDGHARAIEVINDGLQKQILPPDYQTYVALAQAHYFGDEQNIEEAIAAYQKAAPLAPTGETYLNLAKLLSNEGRLAEAKEAAQRALDKGVRSPEDARRILARSN
ncbi:tetratricopeptide repeat protein [Luteimonas sp. J29]|jgi:tetratricopeptide (TPR) repeat protein|uniref:tetratricopeptide repeat protein n=1 Tax=Luteimonas sp. J29 TaxID=935863 RepID=UPI00047C95C2|nr:tetratricopeptide repeat protein [Luteimonas sp. J29]